MTQQTIQILESHNTQVVEGMLENGLAANARHAVLELRQGKLFIRCHGTVNGLREITQYHNQLGEVLDCLEEIRQVSPDDVEF